jgi:hypothetical protein
MKRILFIAMIAALAISPSMAQETCASKAFDKNGKAVSWCCTQQLREKM